MLTGVYDLLLKLDYYAMKNRGHVDIHKVVTHSKRITEGALYFHMRKEKIHFQILRKLNHFVLVTEEKPCQEHEQLSGTILYVKNAKKAYWTFIDLYRQQFQIPVIGITGTCGKTTTKEMLKHILKKRLNVHSTWMSQNGLHLCLPYMLGINEKTDAAIFEMGVAYPGNIKISGKYFQPTIGLITNIGEAHLEGCRTLEKYIEAKGEMLEILPQGGVLILNGDDENIRKLPVASFQGKFITYGFYKDSHFRAEGVQYEGKGMRYSLHFENNMYECFIPCPGEHNVSNSLAAIAAAFTIGIPIEEAIERLKTFQILDRHVKVKDGLNGCTIIDDTWSCNPSSVQSALSVLKNMSNGKKEVLVLGKMQRLGKQLEEQHRALGRTIMENGGVDFLITIGRGASLTGEKVLEYGMEPRNVIHVSTAEELDQALLELCTKDYILLFKLSLGKMGKTYQEVLRKYLVRRAK